MDPNTNSTDDSAAKLINMQALEELFQGNDDFKQALLGKMHGQIPELMEKMAGELAGGDHDAMGKTAHKLKSTVTYLGVGEFRDLLQLIESSCKAGTGLEEVSGAYQKARVLSDQVMRELSEML